MVGAGFAGLHVLDQLRRRGFSCHAYESASGVGGTWFWNRYPGARCDVESLDYSYLHDRELYESWQWSERFAGQPEILRYAEHFADRRGLWPHITFGTTVVGAVFEDGGWSVRTDAGERVRCRFLVTAVGCMSAVHTPAFPGLDSFGGTVLRTSRWPAEPVGLAGRRVGVIGTGSSGIQVVPELAKEAAELVVFQRTANFSVPARNRPLTQAERDAAVAGYERKLVDARTTRFGHPVTGTGRAALETDPAERTAELDRAWARGGTHIVATFTDTGRDLAANAVLADYFRERVRAVVRDPGTAEALVPSGYPIGTKRLCVDDGYHETFNLPHVRLVDLRADPIEAVTEKGVRTARGEHVLDVLVLATGFDAFTGALTRLGVRGRGGRSLGDVWRDGPRSYLGLAVAGFPNLFTVTGPGSTMVLSNVLRAIEHHVEWLCDLLVAARDRGAVEVEALESAQDEWVARVAELAGRTLYPRTDSYYVGANVEGKARVFAPFAGGLDAYRRICDGVAAEGYRGFRFA
ncbi:NAD(P)/FAD-dependent oxidoreductase [Amycolatopsis sp. MtRt-6]|uniref:flavin-containing monooxygenase n=1 Tax=Amycolatopsis sp. MtRt-6 TaxID=2792782 RepID=UPI0027DC2429|nr:NAD(P)/FAD-dependent oxidoreductase [Amycolatopsis sp. MtRt-6]